MTRDPLNLRLKQRVRCEAGPECFAYGQSAHCGEHPDFGCSGSRQICYARDDSDVFRCVPLSTVEAPARCERCQD